MSLTTLQGKTGMERRIVSAAGQDADYFISLGVNLSSRHRYADAERAFLRAIELDPSLPMPHNNLGWIRERLGKEHEAVACYWNALELNPELVRAKVNLSTLLVRLGRIDDAHRCWRQVQAATDRDRKATENLFARALHAGDLQMASVFADAHAYLYGSTLEAAHHVSIPKLEHDLAQFLYLQANDVIVEDLSRIIDGYRDCLDRAKGERQNNERWRMTEAEHARIGQYYNRMIHRPDTPRVPQALSDTWDGAAAEAAYLEKSASVAVVDAFLTDRALEGLRRFCLESVIWFNNTYAHGRLGTLFGRGFNCPLLIQIGEEIAARFPNVIGPERCLRQVWAYKLVDYQPPTHPHADFAAVNVNFWITPDSANLDPDSGGMTVYNVQAPATWSFDRYNRNGREIVTYLQQSSAQAIEIPYRANRAVIFDSDLFHGTQPVSFRNDYASRRVNVTFLFGLREQDIGFQPAQ
jgi:tetratricopeptide (TPR) repeat protein